MPNWKRVRVTFPTIKLGQFIEPVKETVTAKQSAAFKTVYGVTNVQGITVTGKKASDDISNYIVMDKRYFAYNPYRINVGSIGFNSTGLQGCVSPAYVVFKTKTNLSPEFLFAYLKSDFGNHLINWYGNRGGVRNALRYDDLCEIDIPAIDYKTQLELVEKIEKTKSTLGSFTDELAKQLENLICLRQIVLQEAIEGNLTAEWRKQNPSLIRGDNHALKLLDKIKIEKECLISEGKIKKGKPLLPLADAEKPFAIPDGWAWCRLGKLSELITKGSSPNWQGIKYVQKGQGIRFITSKNVNLYTVDLSDETFVEDTFNNIEPRSVLQKGDILTNIVGASIGRTAIYELEDIANINQAVCLIRIRTNFVDKMFILDWMNSPWLINKMHEDEFAPGRANLSMSNVSNFVVPFPPLAEQQAIVEKVEQLMATIGELEKQVTERKDQAELLMQSILREAFAG